MSDRVLIDTSVWVEYFTGPAKPVFDEVSRLLRDRRVAYTGMIELELIRGAKSEKELSTLDLLFQSIDKIDEQAATYQAAGRLGYKLARKGATIGTVDLLISQVALDHEVWLYTHDRHFDFVAKHMPLKLYDPARRGKAVQ